MRALFTATLVATGLLAGAATAQVPWTPNAQAQACYEQARLQALRGEALKEFMADCTANRLAERPSWSRDEVWQRCDERTRLLQGEEKRLAMRDCAARW